MKLIPKVSVIIPAYNAMTFLPETVESVLNQTFTDFEVIVVNDGSSDNVEQWLSEIKDPRVRLISQKNQGVSQARNTGILNSRGMYIAFLDADDLWEPTKLEKQVRCLDENAEIGLVDTWIYLIDERGDILFPTGFSYEPGNVWKQLLEQNIVLCGSTPMVRRCCFDTVGLFDRELHGAEDWYMWTCIAAHYSFQILKEPLVRYRQHFSSASKNFQMMELNTTKAIEKIYESVPSNLQWLKRRTYGRTCRAVAGGAYGTANYYIAIRYYLRTIFYYPQLCFAGGLVRPLLKSILHIGLGNQGYVIHNFARKLKGKILIEPRFVRSLSNRVG